MLFSIACTAGKKAKQDKVKKSIDSNFVSEPPVLVYKTKANYNNLVPVLLSDDKKVIVSYPHPNDIKTGSGYSLPVLLHDGYLLDNRGIGKNVAFLKMTYEEYGKLEKPLSVNELYNLILDKDPLVELCNCGVKSSYKNLTKQMNELIDSKKLGTTCKKML